MNSTIGIRRISAGTGRGGTPKLSLPAPKRTLPGQPPASHLVFARLVEEDTGKPLSGAAWEIVDAQGKAVAAGKTDFTGVVRHDVKIAGKYTVRLAS